MCDNLQHGFCVLPTTTCSAENGEKAAKEEEEKKKEEKEPKEKEPPSPPPAQEKKKKKKVVQRSEKKEEEQGCSEFWNELEIQRIKFLVRGFSWVDNRVCCRTMFLNLGIKSKNDKELR